MKIKIAITFVISLLFLSFRVALKHPIEELPQKFYLPDDLKIELWAESPMLYNPTNMDTDIKGRIWVTEGVNYRNFNNDSTTFFHHEKGDRIVILTDTDQDGKADKSQVFVQDKDLVAPLGIAVFGKEIIVSCAPYLIKYTDEDGDDKPDKKEIILKGFGGLDHDHSLHSVVGGPDGKWYFSVGNAGPHHVTDKAGFTIRSGSIYSGGSPHNVSNKGNQISDDGKVWVGGLLMSIRPDATGLQVLGHNFRNSYETYVDGFGDMWQNDNDEQVVTCRVSWLAEGSNAGFFSEDGTRYWNADQRPNQKMFTAHWHQEDPKVMPAGDNSGAGSPTGMLRNEGDGLGPKYRGIVWSADAGRNVLFGYQPQKTSSGYDLNGKRTIFLSSNASDDPAYQWNNKDFLTDKSKWFRPSDMLIGTDGALYVADWYDAVVGGHQIKDQKAYGRIYKISPKNKTLKSPKLSFDNVEGQLNAFKNPAVNVRYQAFIKLKEAGEKNFESVKKLLLEPNPFTSARALWLLFQMGEKGQNFMLEKLRKGTENERIIAIRAIRQTLPKAKLLKEIDALASDVSPFVRREAIISLEKVAYQEKKAILKSFSEKIPLSDKYYVNALAFALGKDGETFFAENKVWFNSKFELAFALHPANALAYFEKIALNENEVFEKRKKAVTAIGFIKSKEAVLAMLNLKKAKNAAIADLASYWLSFRSTNDWLELYDWTNNAEEIEKQKVLTKMLSLKEKILNENIAFNDRKNAATEMLKDKVGSQIVLDLVKSNTLSPNLVEVVTPILTNSNDANIKYQAQNLLGSNTEVFNQKEILALKGDFEKGKTVFTTYCKNCHKMGTEGISIGPELTKIHEKLDKSGLYEALNYPSSSIVFGYETYAIATKSGNSFYGFIIAENEKSLTIKDISGNLVTILQKDIKVKTKDSKSVMPTASSFQFNKEQLSDLIEYLSQKKP